MFYLIYYELPTLLGSSLTIEEIETEEQLNSRIKELASSGIYRIRVGKALEVNIEVKIGGDK